MHIGIGSIGIQMVNEMWKYIKRYLLYGTLAAIFMVGEVLMDLLQPEIMSKIVDDGVLGVHSSGVGDMGLIWTLGLKMICLVLFGGLCGSLNNAFVHMTGQNVGNEIRKDAFCNLMTFSFPQVDRFGTGSLVTRVTNDITQVQNLVSQFIRGMIRTDMLMFGSIFYLFRLNTHFGLIVLCALPLIVGCLVLCLSKANPLFSRLQAQLDRINAIMQEDISGIRIIKACIRESYEKLRFGKAIDDLIRTQLHVLTILAFMNPVINALVYVVVALILRAGAVEVAAGVTTPGSIMAAITYTTQLLNGIMGLTMLFQNISRGFASWKRVKEILRTEPELRDGPFEGQTKLHGKIEFRDVSFAYPGSDQMVLKHINLTIHPGETLAVMGATGCGKSSLVNLIPRFYDVTQGSVLVDDVDVREYNLKALRQKISVALQKAELFHQTIGQNISWGKEDADGKAIEAAVVIAQAKEFVDKMPDGHETMVAERGASLSGGQKQRISIARAVVKQSEILIFDDATSALDLKTEANLYATLKQARPACTKIIVAQRIASARQADQIVVLENGSVAACGSHAELLRDCQVYRDIYDSQMGKEDRHG
ncbi:ABC transporter ATP-binding protein/permease [Blautia glucerasea]|uniref:ABC transporter ATP-binding protein n=1 Tax=Blautia glucerasea TaxID=536633 RepID=UPI001D024C22|nr:ABC transporter ATP-binding protein [Blautia glucerasea]MCB5388044.1 ABC transporter ATP-binding protein/permease [Blautia glucerasea]MCB5422382.1 ABC transporter ATP-binding protein/permease [Blautia luti]